MAGPIEVWAETECWPCASRGGVLLIEGGGQTRLTNTFSAG